MDTVGESDTSGESSGSESDEQVRRVNKIRKERIDERETRQYNMKESWEDESLVEENGGASEEEEADGGEDQSIKTVSSRDSWDKLVIKESTDVKTWGGSNIQEIWPTLATKYCRACSRFGVKDTT